MVLCSLKLSAWASREAGAVGTWGTPRGALASALCLFAVLASATSTVTATAQERRPLELED